MEAGDANRSPGRPESEAPQGATPSSAPGIPPKDDHELELEARDDEPGEPWRGPPQEQESPHDREP